MTATPRWLSHCFAVSVADGFEQRIGEYCVLPLGERCPCLMCNAFVPEEIVGGSLLEERVGLKLIDCGLHLIVQEEVLQSLT